MFILIMLLSSMAMADTYAPADYVSALQSGVEIVGVSYKNKSLCLESSGQECYRIDGIVIQTTVIKDGKLVKDMEKQALYIRQKLDKKFELEKKKRKKFSKCMSKLDDKDMCKKLTEG